MLISQGLRAAHGRPAPVFRSFTFLRAAASGSHVLTTPAGAASGDYLIAFINASSARSAMTCSGFTSHLGSSTPSGNPSSNVRVNILGMKLAAAPASTYTFSFPLGTSGVSAVFVCVRPDGIPLDTITLAGGYSTTTQSSTSFHAPSLTPTKRGILFCAFAGYTSPTSLSGPSDMTLVSADTASTPDDRFMGVYRMNVSSIADTGQKTTTNGTSMAFNGGSIFVS